ncbi:glycogen synthase [Ruminiclostridium hungatei]|uniref:Glycogen synthase n=1 Tax=Ruminiclostridium hungatei TaxID=48256 RepID=A0A1V4SLR2_RUMHU|nr:glycosyltransferase [Ruminiclostridium hungatei]OPX44822.1 glycogen synthase [Ruminiclostridium hungatei]
MRILVVNKFLYNKGGSETYIFQLFNYLSKLGHEIEYFGMENANNHVGNSACESMSSMDFSGTLFNKLSYPFKVVYSVEARKKIGRVIEKFKPDIIHLNNYNYQITPSILYEIKKYDIPVVQTLHDPQLVCPYHRLYNYTKGENCEKCSHGKFINCIFQKCIDNSLLKSVVGAAESYIYNKLGVYGNVDYFISPSRFLKNKMLSMNVKIPKDKIIILHNFTNNKTAEHTDNKKAYVLYFGRLSGEKGIHTLIKSCIKLPDIRFIFAGEGELEEEVQSVKNIEFIGFKKGDELKRIIAEALFSIYPSEWYENCPMSVLESQMYGTPVIGSNIGGIPELISDKMDGLLFEPGNVEDLTEKVKYLYEKPEILQRFSLACLEKARGFSIEKYTDELLDIYAMAGQKHRGRGKLLG